MKTHADKTQENKNQAVAKEIPKQTDGEFTVEYEDKRPEAIAQRKFLEMEDNRPEAKKPRAFMEMEDNRPEAKKLRASQEMVDNSPRMVRQRQQSFMLKWWRITPSLPISPTKRWRLSST